MGWWGKGVMHGDSPLDWEQELNKAVGGGYKRGGCAYSRKKLEEGLDNAIRAIESAPLESDIGWQVLGVMALKKGAKLPDDVRSKVIKAATNDIWAQTDRDRRAHMQDLIEALVNLEPGRSVELPTNDALLGLAQKRMVQEQYGPVRVGVAAIIRKDGKVLLGLRRGSHGANTWSFPGGHQEFGEDPCTTASRELLEETGISIPAERFQRLTWTNDFFEKERPLRHYITIYMEAYYEGSIEPQVKEPAKCVGWQWFEKPPTELFLPVQHLLEQEPEAFYGRSRR